MNGYNIQQISFQIFVQNFGNPLIIVNLNVILTDTKVEYEYKVTMDLDVDPNLAN